MRVVAEIPNKDFKITIFSWNGKYLIKFEKGMYEQTFKVSEMDVNNDDEIRKLIADEEFINAAIGRFKEMNMCLNEGLNRI